MAAGAGLGIGLAHVFGVDGLIDLHAMIDQTAAVAVVMTGKTAGVAIFALAGAVGGRAGERTAGGQMAGQAAIFSMDLAAANKRRVAGVMAAGAIYRGRGGNGIDRHRGGMAVAVAVEVSGMALDAGAAHAAIDPGIAMAVVAKAPAAVSWIVAGVAAGMDTGDPIAGVAVDAECGRGHRGCMVVDVAVEIGSVTSAARLTSLDDGRVRPVGRVLQGRRYGVAV